MSAGEVANEIANEIEGVTVMARDRDAPIVISDQDARQGEIILRKRWQRIVFIAGLVGMVAIVVIAHFLGHH